MTAKNETSRHRLLDAIECIKNCEALVSHCNEIMDSLYDHYMESDPEKKDDISNRKYECCSKMRAIATKIRRNMMKKIMIFFEDADHDYWCILKHAVSIKQFADETLAGEPSGIFTQEAASSYKLMSLALSQFIGEEQQMCARCMLDDLLGEEDDTIILADNHLDVWFKYRGVLDDKRDLRDQSDVFIGDFFIVKNDGDKEINEEFVWTGEWGFKHPSEITDEMKKEMRLAAKKEQDENAGV